MARGGLVPRIVAGVTIVAMVMLSGCAGRDEQHSGSPHVDEIGAVRTGAGDVAVEHERGPGEPDGEEEHGIQAEPGPAEFTRQHVTYCGT